MANLSVRRGETGERAIPTTWDPFRMMDPFRSWDPFRMLREVMGGDPFSGMVPGGPSAFAPDIEVKETKSAYVICVDLPGVNEGDVDVSMIGHRLTVSARREEEERHEEDRYFTYERSYGGFSRSFVIPEGADMEGACADLKNGVLRIEVPKRAEMHPRRVEIGRKGVEQGSTTMPAQAGPSANESTEPKKAA